MEVGRRSASLLLALSLLVAHAGVVVAQPPVPGPEAWTLVDPGLGPRYGHTLTYDPVGNRLILFGGARDQGGSPIHLNDTWALSLSDLTWRPLNPVGAPPPGREYHTAVYDTPNHRVLIFGGTGDHLSENGDVWALSLGATPSWTHMTPGGTLPGSWFHHAAIYDPVGVRMITYGGNLGTFSDAGEIHILSLSGTPIWSTATPPGFNSIWRRGHTATYDPVGQRMIVVGGGSGSFGTQVAMSLSLSGTMQWTAFAPNGPITDLHDHTAVYDAADNSILVFGGFISTSGINNFTWRLSLGASPAWTKLTLTGTLPAERELHAAAYDPVADRMLIHGGQQKIGSGGATEETQETWTLRLGDSPPWLEADPSGAQPQRGYRAAMSADPAAQRMIVTGGNLRDKVYSNQAHAKSTTGEQLWHPLGATGTPPSGRAGHTTIVDAAHHRLVLFGGETAGGTNVTEVYSNEVWVSPLGSSPAWTQLFPAGGPPSPRSDHTAIYDAAHQRMVVFGGTNGAGGMLDAWSLSLDDNPTWTPIIAGGDGIPARYLHSAIYDAPRGRMIVFGGTNGGTTFNDVRALSLGDSPEWTLLSTSGLGPPNLYGHDAIYDPVGQRMLVFGGTSAGTMQNGVWSLPLWKPSLVWRHVLPLGTLPDVRSSAAADYDPGSGNMYVFGGGTPSTTSPRFDTWTLTLASCAPPVISVQPVNATLPFGTTATFSVSATGAVGYRWQKAGVPLADGGRVSGATTATLQIAAFQASDQGTYGVQVFGACDTVSSDAATLSQGCVAGQANPPAHMAAWWAMDPGPGNTVPDVLNTKSNKNHASLTGGATLVPGLIGNAVRCNGASDGLHVPSTLSPELAKNATGLSIDAWIYPRSGSSNNAFRMILCKGLLAHNTVKVNGADQLAPGYALYLHGGGQLGFQMPDHAYQPVRIEPVLAPMTMDAWHHVAVALAPAPNGGGLFVDGVRVHTFTPPSGIIGNLADLYIGRFPPQLGPAVADSTFNGDIDEVEVFTAPIPDADVHALWLASCAGKRREMALVQATAEVRKSTDQAEVCGSIANFAAAPASYQWTLQALGTGPGCPDAVPVTFTPSSGSLAVATGDFGTVSAVATIDAPLTAPVTACYRLTVTNLADGGTFSADGQLVFYNSSTSARAGCTPPTPGTPGLVTQQPPLHVRGSQADATTGDQATFSVTNDSTDAVQLDYQLTTRDPDTGGPSALLGLGGQSPGTPVSGSLLIPAQTTVELPVTVSLAGHEPFLRDQVVLTADLDGDLVPETLASSYVRSLEDTSLALLAVDPGGTRAPRLAVTPNPFRGAANVLFVLPESRAVDVGVFDVLGRRVRLLRAGLLPAGEHRLTWDGRRDGGALAPGGLYFVRVVAGSTRLSTKIVSIR